MKYMLRPQEPTNNILVNDITTVALVRQQMPSGKNANRLGRRKSPLTTISHVYVHFLECEHSISTCKRSVWTWDLSLCLWCVAFPNVPHYHHRACIYFLHTQVPCYIPKISYRLGKGSECLFLLLLCAYSAWKLQNHAVHSCNLRTS